MYLLSIFTCLLLIFVCLLSIFVDKKDQKEQTHEPFPSQRGTFAALTGDPQNPKAAKEPCCPSRANARYDTFAHLINIDYI